MSKVYSTTEHTFAWAQGVSVLDVALPRRADLLIPGPRVKQLTSMPRLRAMVIMWL